MTLLAAGKPFRITPGVTLSRICPYKHFLCVRLCPWVLHECRSREGITNIPYCSPRGAFVTCPAAVGNETEKLESGSLSLFNCKMHLDLWGFQYKAASGSAPPQDRRQGYDCMLPRAIFIPLQEWRGGTRH